MEKKLQKIYPTYYILLKVQDIMATSLSNLVNNLSEGIHRIKCKFGRDDKKCKICRIKYKYFKFFLEYSNFKDDLIKYQYLEQNLSTQG